MEANAYRVLSRLQPEEILLDIEARDREHALEIAARAIGKLHAIDWAPISRALCRREQAGSTGLGEGFAIPHARMSAISRPTTVYMRTSAALQFHAPDGERVSDFFVIMVPSDGANEDHLHLLALVARLFSDGTFRTRLHNASTVAAATEVFRTGIEHLATSPT